MFSLVDNESIKVVVPASIENVQPYGINTKTSRQGQFLFKDFADGPLFKKNINKNGPEKTDKNCKNKLEKKHINRKNEPETPKTGKNTKNRKKISGDKMDQKQDGVVIGCLVANGAVYFSVHGRPLKKAFESERIAEMVRRKKFRAAVAIERGAEAAINYGRERFLCAEVGLCRSEKSFGDEDFSAGNGFCGDDGFSEERPEDDMAAGGRGHSVRSVSVEGGVVDFNGC